MIMDLKSSIYTPWVELPIRMIIGGAYSANSLLVHKLNYAEAIDTEIIVLYLLTARYDHTAFMKIGRR